MQISETPFMTCRIYLHVYSLNYALKHICMWLPVMGGRQLTNPLKKTEKAREILKNKTSCNRASCSHVFLRNSCFDNHLRISRFLETPNCRMHRLQAFLKSPSSSWSPPLFATSTSDDVEEKTLLKRETARLMTRIDLETKRNWNCTHANQYFATPLKQKNNLNM